MNNDRFNDMFDMFQAREEDRLRMCCCQPLDDLTTPPNIADITMLVVLSKRVEQLQKLLEANGIDIPEWPTFEEVMGNDS